MLPPTRLSRVSHATQGSSTDTISSLGVELGSLLLFADSIRGNPSTAEVRVCRVEILLALRHSGTVVSLLIVTLRIRIQGPASSIIKK